MSRRRQELAALRALQRRVWGDKTYEKHLYELARTRQRRRGVVGIVAGAQLLLVALAVLLFAGPASAHTSQITMSCTQVQFNYSDFPETAVTAHESLVINGHQGLQRDFQFTGPSAIDIIMIDILAPGSATVHASTNWSFFGQPQGSAELTKELSDCTQPKSTSTTSSSTTTTSTTVKGTTTTIAETTSVPTTSTSVPASTTTSQPTITTTSSIAPSSTTSISIVPQGSTTTSAPVSPGRPPTTVAAVPPTTLPFTGSSTQPFSFALGMLGLGAIASGLATLKRGGRAG